MAVVEVVGNAGNDVELKYISGAKGDFAVASFSLAEQQREKKNGEWVDGETLWWRVSVTGQLAESLADMSLKGVRLLVKGDLKQFSYTSRDGQTKTGYDIKATSITQVINKPKAKAQEAQDTSWPF